MALAVELQRDVASSSKKHNHENDETETNRRLDRLERVLMMVVRDVDQMCLRDKERDTNQKPISVQIMNSVPAQTPAPAQTVYVVADQPTKPSALRTIVAQMLGGWAGAGRGWPGGNNEIAALADSLTFGGFAMGWLMGTFGVTMNALGFRYLEWYARLAQNVAVAQTLVVLFRFVVIRLEWEGRFDGDAAQHLLVVQYVLFACLGASKISLGWLVVACAHVASTVEYVPLAAFPKLSVGGTVALVFSTMVLALYAELPEKQAQQSQRSWVTIILIVVARFTCMVTAFVVYRQHEEQIVGVMREVFGTKVE